MIECHVGRCENHICHTDAGEGPFCALNQCEKTSEEIIEMMKEARAIPVYDFIPEEERVVMKEFMLVCATVFSLLASATLLTWVVA